MTRPAEGYGTGKFGGVKTANIMQTISSLAKSMGTPDKMLGVGLPLVGGVAAMELLDPISEVFKPMATDAGERMSAGLGLAETPWEQMAQKGLDSIAYHGAKELAAGMAAGVGAGGQAGLGLLRRPASFATMVQGDPVLSQAPRAQHPLLEQSYQAMQRVAPQLSQEPFVTKNFLRDIMVTNQGPDHATLSSLARSEQTIADAQGGGWGGR